MGGVVAVLMTCFFSTLATLRPPTLSGVGAAQPESEAVRAARTAAARTNLILFKGTSYVAEQILMDVP